jgi:hypothetical protein
MSKGNGSKYWLLIVGVVVAVVWVRSCEPTPLTLASAVQSDKVSVNIKADGNSGGSAIINVVRSWDTSGKVVVIIPAGTLLFSENSGTQRLMTAVEVRVVLTDEKPQVNTPVQTYCLDEFAPPPNDSSALSIDPPPGGSSSTTEETEPLHKLADCMATSSVAQGDKQLAIWAVKEDLLSKSRADALQFITAGLVGQMSQERRDQLNAKKPEAEQLARDLSEQEIDAAIDTEFQNSLVGIRQLAATKANQQLTSLIEHDREMLSSCGYSVADKPLFQ